MLTHQAQGGGGGRGGRRVLQTERGTLWRLKSWSSVKSAGELYSST